jgi:DNA-binding MurR/RpiR family transcriptional regulator
MGLPENENSGTATSAALRDMPLLERFRVLRDKLTNSERLACEYFLNHPESVYLSITDVVQESGVSYGCVMRFCRKVGCVGFQEFKVLLAQELAKGQHKKSKGPSNPFQETVEKTKRDIVGTHDLLDEKTTLRAARLISKARRILVGGIAGSAAPVIGFEYKLSRLGLPSAAITEGYNLAIRAATLNEKDVFVVISFSGATRDVLHAAEVARSNGATVICLTAFLKAPLVELSDISFFLSTDHDPMSCEAFSTIPCDFVLDVLFAQLCKVRRDACPMIEKTFHAVSDKRL